MSNTLKSLESIMFPVEKLEMNKIAKGFATNSKDKFAIVGHPADGKIILNTCSEQYNIVQNADVLNPLVGLIEKQFSQVKVRVINEENARFDVNMVPVKAKRIVGELLPRFNYSNSYDGTGKAILEGGIYRLVCENGAAVPIKGKSFRYTFKHNDAEILIPETWEEVTAMLHGFIKELPAVETSIEKMKKKKIEVTGLTDFLEEISKGTLFPKKAIGDAANRANAESVQLNEKMNVWLAYNGLNYVLNHDREYKIVQHVRNTIDSKLLQNAMAFAE